MHDIRAAASGGRSIVGVDGCPAGWLALAEREFPGAYADARAAFARGAVANDDALDALAALWTARRIRLGVAIAVQDDRPRDAHDLRMFITA